MPSMSGRSSMAPFVTHGSYSLSSRDAAARRSVNMYTQSTEGQGKYDIIALGTPGTVLEQDLTTAGASKTDTLRGMYYTSLGTVYSVYGSYLYETVVDATSGLMVTTQILKILSNTGRCSMADNGKWLVLVDGAKMYCVNLANHTVQYPDLPFTGPMKVVYMNQQFYCITNSTATAADKTLGNATNLQHNCIFWSYVGLDGCVDITTQPTSNGKGWDPLAYTSLQNSPDAIQTIMINNGQLWVFASRSYEVFTNSGNADLPIAYAAGSATEYGIRSPWSAWAIGGTVFWLGSSAAGSNQVFAADSSMVAHRISNHALEYHLGMDSDATGSSYAWAYQQEGHTFYVLTIPPTGDGKRGNVTWVYDLGNGGWHERSSRDPMTAKDNAWECAYGIYAFEKILVGNNIAPVIMSLNLRAYTDYDSTSVGGVPTTKPIVRVYQAPQYWENLKWDTHDRFQLDLQFGVGTQVGQGFNPQVMLQKSDDGGYTFGRELWKSIGKIGQYQGRAVWRMLGISRERVYRITISDPIEVVILGAKTTTRLSANE